MSPERQRDTVALVCDEHGLVREVLIDEGRHLINTPRNLPLSAYVDPTSMTKAQNFLQEVEEKGIALDWEMGIAVPDGVLILRFTGIRQDRQTVVVGAQDISAVMDMYEQILSMHGDQITILRAEVKRRKELAEQLQRMNLDGYEEVTRLNNELMTMQREMVKKTRQLEALNQEKNMYLGIAAHDLRNPIGNILNLSKLLQDDLQDQLSEENTLYFGLINSSCEFLLRLISDVLDFSQIESGQMSLEMQTIDLRKLVLQQVEYARKNALAKGLELSFDSQGEEPFLVDGDSVRLTQVVDNLVSNAVKFSSAPNRVEVFLQKKADSVLFVVRDHGPGITLQEQGSLFQPFNKATARPTAGERSTGLGLSIVKRIVDAHKGTIELESEPGQGTTIRVWLPVQ